MKISDKFYIIAIVILSASGTVFLIFYTRWLVNYVIEISTSLEKNFLLFALWIICLLGVSFAEGVICRFVHKLFSKIRGKEAVSSMEISGKRTKDEMFEEIQRRVKETKTLWTVYIAIPLVANIFVMNHFGNGYILAGQGGITSIATLNTMLRSRDEMVRKEGIKMAVTSSDPRAGKMLVKIIMEGGELSKTAAWAAGIRKQKDAKDALRHLYRTGDQEQKGVAIVALSEIQDYDIIKDAVEELERNSGAKEHILIALGNLGEETALDAIVKVADNDKESEKVRAISFWAISKIQQERFKRAWMEESASIGFDVRRWKAPERHGWQPLVKALSSNSKVLQCGAVQALKYAGPVECSKNLIEFFERTERFEKCDRLTFKPYQWKSFEIISPGLLRTLILSSLAGIGDRSIASWLDKVAADRKNADEVILIAADLARQIRKLK